MAVLKQGVELVKATFKDFFDDEATWKAAALAYYTVFALPPLLVLLLQVASAIWDPVEVRRTLTGEFQSLMGQDVAGQIQTMITSAEQKASGTGLRLVLSIGGLIFGATGAFVSLQSALNRAWEVEPDPKKGGIRNFITKRFLSLGMVLGIAFLLLVSLALTSALSAAGGALLGGLPEAVGQVLNFVFSFAVITLLFAGMFKVLPDAKVEWRDVWVGAVVTALLFVVGKFLIGFYIGQSDPGNAFGAAGALAVLLVWIYYAAVIVLLGAAFTQAWIRQRGRRIEPEEGAVRVVERKERVGESRAGAAKAGTDARSRGDVEGAEDRRPLRPASSRAPSGRDAGQEGEGRVETIADARREIEATRERMSQTVARLDARISDRVGAVKRLDLVTGLVKDHPWPAMAAAIVAGVALSATRADQRVAVAGAHAARRAPELATDAAKAVTRKAASLASSAASRIGGAPDDHPPRTDSSRGDGDGFVARARTTISDVLRAQTRELGEELGRGADELIGLVVPHFAAAFDLARQNHQPPLPRMSVGATAVPSEGATSSPRGLPM